MTVEQDKELTQQFTEWMALEITHDAHVIAWLRAPGSPVSQYVRLQAEHAKLARTPDELAFDRAFDAWGKVDELLAERSKVDSWRDDGKQFKDERGAELKRIDSAIAELIEDKAPAQNTATPAPVVAVVAAGGVEPDKAGLVHGLLTKEIAVTFDGVEPELNLPWWQAAYNIHDLWQNIGETLHSQEKRTSNTAIAKGIAKRINDIERSKGRNRVSPNWDTIRGKFSGWVWKAEKIGRAQGVPDCAIGRTTKTAKKPA